MKKITILALALSCLSAASVARASGSDDEFASSAQTAVAGARAAGAAAASDEAFRGEINAYIADADAFIASADRMQAGAGDAGARAGLGDEYLNRFDDAARGLSAIEKTADRLFRQGGIDAMSADRRTAVKAYYDKLMDHVLERVAIPVEFFTPAQQARFLEIGSRHMSAEKSLNGMLRTRYGWAFVNWR